MWGNTGVAGSTSPAQLRNRNTGPHATQHDTQNLSHCSSSTMGTVSLRSRSTGAQAKFLTLSKPRWDDVRRAQLSALASAMFRNAAP